MSAQKLPEARANLSWSAWGEAVVHHGRVPLRDAHQIASGMPGFAVRETIRHAHGWLTQGRRTEMRGPHARARSVRRLPSLRFRGALASFEGGAMSAAERFGKALREEDPASGRRRKPAPRRALPEQEHSEAGLPLLLAVSAVLERLGILDMFDAGEQGGDVTLNHRGPWDPDEMVGVRDALDEKGLCASWVGGLTIIVRGDAGRA